MEKIEANKCHVVNAMDPLIGKWKVNALLHLMYGGTKRFNELKRLMPGVTQKMLTSQLRELEENDIIQRIIYPEVPPRVEYSMTTYGKTLIPIIESMHDWGASHLDHLRAKALRKLDDKSL
jgi:DNA-binding HxlR family transcriptional regulator